MLNGAAPGGMRDSCENNGNPSPDRQEGAVSTDCLNRSLTVAARYFDALWRRVKRTVKIPRPTKGQAPKALAGASVAISPARFYRDISLASSARTLSHFKGGSSGDAAPPWMAPLNLLSALTPLQAERSTRFLRWSAPASLNYRALDL